MLTQELKLFENFDNAKNKLLKNSAQKLDNYSEKNYSDFVREFSTALNQLKITVLNKLSDVKTKEKIIS